MTGRFEFVLIDPVRDSSLKIAIPHACRVRTLGDLFSFYRFADLETLASASASASAGQLLELRRYADSLFLLTDGGALGELDPDLRFKIGGRACDLDHRFDGATAAGPIPIEIDRSHTGYTRNWPAYLSRRWGLRADAFSEFVESVVEEAYGREAGTVLRLDAPDRVRRFLTAVAGRIHAAPYETYSRYLEPCSPFRGCDQTLDRILEGDGGNCAEKAMALYLVAHAYGIQAEVVLGGEEAVGSFPYRTLRSILDRRTFDFAGTQDAQRYWQHYAILCRLAGDAEEHLFCDVAGSNIPFLCLCTEEASAYLNPACRKAIRVAITLEPIRLYYHRLARRQDLPLDLYYAMEHFIESIDVIQTVDNELGLLHTGDYWVGAVAYRGRRELGRIMGEYERFVGRAGFDARADLCFTRNLISARHPLLEQFLGAYPRGASRINAADTRIRQRIRSADPHLETCYVIVNLKKKAVRS
ncbi:hypothetical protein [Singulisphaera sp. GP187]|uniref:hypothetical protein n=1 Tax=Singulisphaera sp. GP187 TaxID=1882752 RepID=UPI000941000C|nr:hypothetical protein [Singulisphaera sp. GP187]